MKETGKEGKFSLRDTQLTRGSFLLKLMFVSYLKTMQELLPGKITWSL